MRYLSVTEYSINPGKELFGVFNNCVVACNNIRPSTATRALFSGCQLQSCISTLKVRTYSVSLKVRIMNGSSSLFIEPDVWSIWCLREYRIKSQLTSQPAWRLYKHCSRRVIKKYCHFKVLNITKGGSYF